MPDETGPREPPAASADPAITPIHAPVLRIIEIGTICWAVALVVTLVVPALHEGDRGWWPWVCVTGVMLGALGWVYVRRGRGNAADAD